MDGAHLDRSVRPGSGTTEAAPVPIVSAAAVPIP